MTNEIKTDEKITQVQSANVDTATTQPAEQTPLIKNHNADTHPVVEHNISAVDENAAPETHPDVVDAGVKAIEEPVPDLQGTGADFTGHTVRSITEPSGLLQFVSKNPSSEILNPPIKGRSVENSSTWEGVTVFTNTLRKAWRKLQGTPSSKAA